MNRTIGSVALAAWLATTTLPAAGADPRVKVDMPGHMVEHMLGNMRDHLQALTEIQRALGRGDMQTAADVAEKRIGLSSLDDHGAAHMAGFMPEPMQAIGTRMHQAASRFARAAQDAGADGNLAKAVDALSQVTAQCVACHAAYRVH